ncbi:Proline iminopeptidase [Zea mays]|uniref:Proline iminopeptidase n=1 Tax=Zea mays TaxID=4577 RepID=A0A1D6M9V3_MAIZE|nr:Proline iminopeptidase [Zea mays]
MSTPSTTSSPGTRRAMRRCFSTAVPEPARRPATGGSLTRSSTGSFCLTRGVQAEALPMLVLRGIFLLRKKEFDWFYEGGAAAIFPDAWEPFRDFIPEDERNCFVDAYNKRLTSSDPIVQVEAAKRWTMWEMMTAQLIQNNDNIKRGEDDEFSLAFARIENHYFVNKGFLPSDSFLLDNVDKIRHIKGFIVQGRYDVCCPMMSAWDLHKAWPEAEFKVVADAGHSANEVGIAAELRSATDKLRDLLRK